MMLVVTVTGRGDNLTYNLFRGLATYLYSGYNPLILSTNRTSQYTPIKLTEQMEHVAIVIDEISYWKKVDFQAEACEQ